MVRIINGEIVQDNDPRLRRTSQLNDPRRVDPAPGPSTAPSQRPAPAQVQSDPIQIVARYLKIENRFVTIPALPLLKLTESRVGLVYFILVGLLTLFAGYKALVFAAVMYLIWKHSEQSHSS